ncbi:MAG: hypothetical protein H0T42_32000 [Deltaproteobacteria bacterium]|nr:hypothetical protein [Deltaproteobacteria bacterium]
MHLQTRQVAQCDMARSGQESGGSESEGARRADRQGEGGYRRRDRERSNHCTDAVRLNEAVLVYSGGHWLSPPAELRWTDEHAAARDRLLRARIDSRPTLLKDPRTLLALEFWRASPVPFHVIGIVRYPLAVARSLARSRAGVA